MPELSDRQREQATQLPPAIAGDRLVSHAAIEVDKYIGMENGKAPASKARHDLAAKLETGPAAADWQLTRDT